MKRIITVVLLLISCAGFAQIKISALPVATGDSGFLPIVQGGVTKKISKDSLVKGVKTDTSFLRRDININTSQTIANAAAIQQRYDSLRRLPGSTQVQGLKSGVWYNAFIDSVGVGGGGGGTTYTGTTPVVVTGSVISVDTTKAQGKLATFNDVDIAKRWGLSGADIYNLNSGDVGIGTLPRYAGFFDVNKNLNVQGSSAGNYMRYLSSIGRLFLLSNTTDAIATISKDNTGTSDFMSMNDNTSGGYISFGSGGSSFLPIIKMSAGSSSNDFAGFTINTRDELTSAAFLIDARKATGPLTNQPLMAVNSYGNERFTVLANGNLKIPILSTSLTAPLTTGTTRMAIVDQFGMFSSLPLPTGGGTATDTSFLRRDINLNTSAIAGKVAIADTSAMLNTYKTAINTKLNITDTANIRLRPIAGTNTTITGSYPNLTFNSTAGNNNSYFSKDNGHIYTASTGDSLWVGTANGTQKFEVNGFSKTGNIGINTAPNPNVGLFVKGTDTAQFTYNTIFQSSVGGNIAAIYNGGKVVIGTLNPSNGAMLTVQGNMAINGNYYYFDNASGGGFQNTSGDIYFDAKAANSAIRFRVNSPLEERMKLSSTEGLVINDGVSSNIGVPSSLLSMNTTTKGILLPRLTTTQINAIASPANGLTVYNITLSTLCFFNGTTWQTVTSTVM